ncbi:hypothetical protein CDO35_08645 [Pseudomonas sediminis]|uniref:Uncharacterized protein n=1 Tax=Pseudomonas sediminis TaxID=1691904 RepID=A0A2G5FP41_9PSED|nr:hypothetical protein CDO35_08645 [Pseudomonas sediminis]
MNRRGRSGFSREQVVAGDSRLKRNAAQPLLQGISKNVGEAASARQKQAKKRSLRVVNEHLTGLAFQPVFNAAMATQVVFRGALQGWRSLEARRA